jgi:hypothetical protein
VPITVTEENFKLKSANHNDAMVIEVNIAGWVIGKTLVDNGSSTDILFLKTFEKMNLIQHMLHPPEYPLQGEDHVWFEDRWMVASLCDE